MFKFKSDDYIVLNEKDEIQSNGAIVRTLEEFISEANDIEIHGDFYCRVKDFDQKIYNLVNSAAPAKWFAITKGEIPDWFDTSKALILNAEEDNSIDQFSNTNFTDVKPTEKPAPVDDSMDFSFDPGKKDGGLDFESFESLVEDSNKGDTGSSSEGKIFVFGSSKGGTGKTFTGIISARRYAMTHSNQKVAIVDFDIIDGQVGITAHLTKPTLMDFYRSYKEGNTSFDYMSASKAKSPHFPANIDFYLAPRDYYIKNSEFWIKVIENVVQNYDAVFFDTGIDYINYEPISFVYKIADRIILVTTTSIKSVSSVARQINKLTGEAKALNSLGEEVFSKEDNIKPKLRMAITNCDEKDQQNDVIFQLFKDKIPIRALFGNLTKQINRAEFYAQWDIFDNDQKFNSKLDDLVNLKM